MILVFVMYFYFEKTLILRNKEFALFGLINTECIHMEWEFKWYFWQKKSLTPSS